MYWFRWDTFEVWKYDFVEDKFMLMQWRPPGKFLFFSAVCHLPNGMGCFILGGSDFEDNYSKKSLFFKRYSLFVEKPPMNQKRAFFAALYCAIDSSVYCFGGTDGQRDLVECERYCPIEGVWRSVSPLTVMRNGAAACAIE